MHTQGRAAALRELKLQGQSASFCSTLVAAFSGALCGCMRAGHTASWGKGYPGLLTDCYNAQEQPTGEKGPINPVRNETYALLWAFLREAAGLFPDTYVHLGGDEVPFECWQVRPCAPRVPVAACTVCPMACAALTGRRCWLWRLRCWLWRVPNHSFVQDLQIAVCKRIVLNEGPRPLSHHCGCDLCAWASQTTTQFLRYK